VAHVARAALVLLLAILAVAAALRFWALDFGHSSSLVRPDEREILLPPSWSLRAAAT
jgi:hypothetical protein